jgi:ferritin
VRMPSELEAAFNRQVTMELASANAYLQMSAWFAHENLPGMASWMRLQAEEERSHADRFLDFILDRGGSAVIAAVPAPGAGIESPLGAFKAALAQEETVTEAIHELYGLATELGDLSSFPFLQDFISEQNEEEASVSTIVDRLERAGGEYGALLILDQQLGMRSATEATGA